MNIDSILKKEGIESIRPLDTLSVNRIAKSVSDKLYLAFFDYGLNSDELFCNLSRIQMYYAKINNNTFLAKYFYKTNSMFFNESISSEEIEVLAVHECIHYIQQVIDSSGNLLKLGLSSYSISKVTGESLNEAAVEIMSCLANKFLATSEKYYNINLQNLCSKNYPLQYSIVKQMIYFTGDYSLFHSTLESTNIFENTFIVKSNKQTFYTIRDELDKLSTLEEELNYVIEQQKLSEPNSFQSQRFDKEIEYGKRAICEKYFKMQNLIISTCFSNEFNSIKTISDANSFKSRLYEYKNLIGYTDDYLFYNNFYCEMMQEVESKIKYIEENGPINLIGSLAPGTAIIPRTRNVFSFFRKLLAKLGLINA